MLLVEMAEWEKKPHSANSVTEGEEEAALRCSAAKDSMRSLKKVL